MTAAKDDDLIGDVASTKAKKAEKPAKAPKKAAKAPAKKAAAKAPAKKAAAKAPAKKSTGDRSERGQGKYYFPSEQREALWKKIYPLAKKAGKDGLSTKQYASEHKVDTFKVRLAATHGVAQKQAKLTKTGKKGGALVIHAL
jgi:hypothetical protein